MEYKYRKDKVVAVIELSSSAIKSIGYMPMWYNPKPEKIYNSMFNDLLTISNNWFDKGNQQIDRDKFKQDILPAIVTVFNKVRRENMPQFIKIVATGYYRKAKNSTIIIKLIENELQRLIFNKKKYSNFKNNIKIHVLSAHEESRYGYLSFIRTLRRKEKTTFKSLFKDKTGLHIDVGSATTEISVFYNEDFTKTISILIELNTFIDLYEEDEKKYFIHGDYYNDIDREKLQEWISNIHFIIQSHIEKELKGIFDPDTINNLCVSTGISNINHEKQDTIKTELNTYDYFCTLKQELEINIERLAFGSKIKGKNSIDIYFNKLIKKYLKYIILDTIYKYFSIKYFYFNLANLRIGIYHELIRELRETYK